MSRKGIVRAASVTTTTALFLPARADRTGLVLFAPVAGNYTVSDSPAITPGSGIYMIAGMAPVNLDEASVGDLTQQALYAVGSLDPTSFGYVEVVGG